MPKELTMSMLSWGCPSCLTHPRYIIPTDLSLRNPSWDFSSSPLSVFPPTKAHFSDICLVALNSSPISPLGFPKSLGQQRLLRVGMEQG